MVARNWRGQGGEVDLIALNGGRRTADRIVEVMPKLGFDATEPITWAMRTRCSTAGHGATFRALSAIRVDAIGLVMMAGVPGSPMRESSEHSELWSIARSAWSRPWSRWSCDRRDPSTVLMDSDAALTRRGCRVGAGLSWPTQLLTINLTPPVCQSRLSRLAIVAAVLAAGTVPRSIASASVLVGEVGLDGRVRQVRGVLPALLAAREAGIGTAIVPAPQIREAQLVSGITIWGVACLDDLIEVLHGRPVLGQPDLDVAVGPATPAGPRPDLADVRGQSEACWAVEVAAAGGHHVFLHGAPGVGKSMLAERLPTAA